VNGVGEAVTTLEREGQLQVTASSNPAMQSTILVVTIQGEQPATIATLIPSPADLISSTAAQSSTGFLASRPTGGAASATDGGAGVPGGATRPSAQLRPRVKPIDLGLALLGMVCVNLGADLLRWRRGWTRMFRLRLSLMGLIAGFVGYLAYALGFMDTGALWRIYGHLGAVLFGVGFSLVPLVSALIGRGIRASE
jgi:hypothetical protein